MTPQDKRVFDPTSPVETTSEILSAYAQDRFDVTDRFNLYLGVRMDDQAFDNDAGTEVHSSTDFAPRLAATYDLGGDGKMLLKATAGRYFQVAGQDLFNENYATKPNGTNVFTQFRWNPATQRYDGAQQRQNLPPGSNPGTFDPYYKDEASIGLEWQFVPAWAFEVRGSMWEESDAYWVTSQFNAAGVVVPDVRNWDDAFREYEGVVLELNRAFRDNWTLRTNYTWGETTGNHFGNNEVALFQDTLFEGLGGIEVCTATSYVGCIPGSTDATIRNREGVGNTGREHILNIVGLKVFPIGEHSIGLGGYFGFRAGERWGLRARRPPSAAPNSDQYHHDDDLRRATWRAAARRHHDAQPLGSLGVPDRGSVQRPAGRRGRQRHQRAGAGRHQLQQRPTGRGQAGVPVAARVSVPGRRDLLRDESSAGDQPAAVRRPARKRRPQLPSSPHHRPQRQDGECIAESW